MLTLHGPHRPLHRVFTVTTFFTLGTFSIMSLGCSSWKATPVTEVAVIKEDKLVQKEVRFHLADGQRTTMFVTELVYPFVRGIPLEDGVHYNADEFEALVHSSRDKVEVDLRDVTSMEIKKGDNGVGVFVALTVVTAAVILIITLLNSDDDGNSSSPPPSSSSSCPVLYVQDGGSTHLVGEPYAGAATGAIQRSDMMPLPTLHNEQTRLLLANEARETQYADFAELIITDHSPETRAVATHEQGVILVGDLERPLSALDGSGADVTTSVELIDGDLWQADLSDYVDDAAPPLTQEIILSFPQPGPDDRPVLELELGNTYWLDMVMNRFLALMGDQFDKGIEKANRKSAGPRIREWMAREGLELKVEYQGPEGWMEIARVLPIGPLALRHVAVPLPSNLHSLGTPELTVRIRGGNGFWKVDQVGLSTRQGEITELLRIPPDVLQGADGIDERELVSAADGHYQVLAELGDSVDLEFTLPPRVPGLARSAFFHSNGYYVAHKPIQSARSLSTLRTILDQEGALARFSLDLYRVYHEIALNAPVKSGSRGDS